MILIRQRAAVCSSVQLRRRSADENRENIKVKLRDGEMGAYIAYPDRTPAGAIIAIMEIWGVNDTMRQHAHEFAEAGFVCLVPDLFWRQEPGVELSDRNPEHVKKAFDLYYEFDYDLGVRDMEDTMALPAHASPECNGKVGAVGYCLGGKLCYLMCCRTDIDCAVAYYGTYIEHNIREVKNLHRPFMLHMAMKDRWVQAEVNDMLERRLVAESAGDDPQISRRRPRVRAPRRQDLSQARGRPRARAVGRLLQGTPGMNGAALPVLGMGFHWQDLAVGQKFQTFRRTITETDLVNFISVTGMLEAIFIDADYSGEHGAIKGRVVPAALTYGLIEGMLFQTMIQGTGLASLEIHKKALKPVFVGDTVRATVEVTKIRPTSSSSRAIVTSQVDVFNQRDEAVLAYEITRMLAGRPGA